ncbi:MAG TPA: PEP-CTERM sorting domain-containing protein [Phycisphaerae bacterium]|nr:PEP-CTERM sorting domain-containing protein [Phycisphaerae bacterium]
MKTKDIKKTKVNNKRIRKHLALVLGALGGSFAPVAAHANMIYVSNHDDGSSSVVSEYTETGTTITSSNPSLIPNTGNLYEPAGLALSGGNVYVANEASPGGTGQITEYNASTGAYVAMPVSSGLSTPLGLAIYGTKMFVANYGNNEISEYTTSGTLLNIAFISGLSGPSSVAISPNGEYLFVGNIGSSGTYSGKVAVYNIISTPTLVDAFSVPHSPFGIAAADNDADIYVTSNPGDSISEYSLSGSLVNTFGSSGTDTLDEAYGIAYNNGNLFVSSIQPAGGAQTTTSGIVEEFNAATGAAISTSPDPLISNLDDPYDIAVAPEPGSLAVLGLGAVGLLLKRKKTRIST